MNNTQPQPAEAWRKYEVCTHVVQMFFFAVITFVPGNRCQPCYIVDPVGCFAIVSEPPSARKSNFIPSPRMCPGLQMSGSSITATNPDAAMLSAGHRPSPFTGPHPKHQLIWRRLRPWTRRFSGATRIKLWFDARTRSSGASSCRTHRDFPAAPRQITRSHSIMLHECMYFF